MRVTLGFSGRWLFFADTLSRQEHLTTVIVSRVILHTFLYPYDWVNFFWKLLAYLSYNLLSKMTILSWLFV